MNILIPVLSGSEFRQFFLSGIVKNLKVNKHNIFSIVKNNDESLTSLLKEYEPTIIILSHKKKSNKRTLLSYLRFILDYEYDLDNERWKYAPNNHISPLKKKILNFISFFLKIEFIKRFMLRLEKKLFSFQNLEEVKKDLKDNNIDMIVMNIARILIDPELLISAYQLNIPVKIIYHSNKEINAQNRISYPYHSFAVWNSKMKDELKPQLSYYNHVNIKIIGNTHFTYLNLTNNLMKKEDFNKRFEIDSLDTIIVLYTAAGVIVKNEFYIVDFISKILKQTNKKYKIIIRQNPMDTTNRWSDYFKNNKQIYIQKPKWIMNNKIGLNYTLPEDLVEYTSLLTYSDICINIPSTVTLECAIKQIPVINVCFNFEGVEVLTNDGEMSSFWNAPFYKGYHEFDFVHSAFNNKELEVKIHHLCKKDIKYEFHDYETCTYHSITHDTKTINKLTENFILNKD